MGYVMTEAELVAAATYLDTNGDGKITYDEFTVGINFFFFLHNYYLPTL